MKKVKATFFSDDGHGWLAVKRQLLLDLGILKQVSGYSYQQGKTVYLEEDSDVTLLFETLRLKYKIDRLTDFFDIKNSHSDTQSPIRNKARFNPNMITNWKQGLTVSLYGNAYIVQSLDKNKVIVQDVTGKRFRLQGKNLDEAITA